MNLYIPSSLNGLAATKASFHFSIEFELECDQMVWRKKFAKIVDFAQKFANSVFWPTKAYFLGNIAIRAHYGPTMTLMIKYCNKTTLKSAQNGESFCKNSYEKVFCYIKMNLEFSQK